MKKPEQDNEINYIMLNNNDVFNDGFHYWMQKYLILISVMQEKIYANLQKNRKKVKKNVG